ncbi:MAG: O-antigen ligase family protein [Gammaproteobacteria bacterium]
MDRPGGQAPRERLRPAQQWHEWAFVLLLALVCLYLTLAPVWYPRLAPRIYDNARLLEFALLVPAAALALASPASAGLVAAWGMLGAAARWLMVVFVTGGAFCAVVSGVPQLGALQVGLLALLLTLFMLVACAVRAESQLSEQLLGAAVFAGVALLVLKFWTSFLLHFVDGRAFSWVSPFLDFANARFFGQYQAYVLLLLPAIAFLVPLNRLARGSLYLVGASFWGLQFMVGTRAVWIGFAAAIVAVLIFMRRGRVSWLRTQAALVLAGGALYFVFSAVVLPQPNATPIPPQNSVIKRNWDSVNERKIMALAAIRLIREHPLTGVGPGQFGFHYQSTIAAHPHNTPLQLWSEYGLIAGSAGVALGVLLAVFTLRRISESSRETPDPVTASVGAALIMGLTDSLLSGNLTMPHSQVLCAVLAGWLAGRSWRERTTPEIGPASHTRMALAGSALLAAAVCAVLALEYLDVIREMPSAPGIRVPNLWQYGRFGAW